MASAGATRSIGRVLVTNDDGINAPGLEVLETVARSLSGDVWVVAPETEQSGAGHSLTLTRPLRIRTMDARRFAVEGTPTDCVLMALHQIMKGARPDIVLSGVNRGANVAEDVTYSGTIAAAMEATLLDVPAIALSLSISDRASEPYWDNPAAHAPDLVAKLFARGWPTDVLINLNFPDCAADQVAGTVVTRQAIHAARANLIECKDPRERPYFWIGPGTGRDVVPDDTDVAAVDRNEISITPLHLDLTHEKTRADLARSFG